MTRRRAVRRIAASILTGVFATMTSAQRRSTPVNAEVPWHVDYGFFKSSPQKDVDEWLISAGLKLRRGRSEVFAQQGVIELDIDAARAAATDDQARLPRRSVPAPDARRVADEAEVERRLASFLAAGGQRPPQRADVKAPTGRELYVGVIRTLYLEGDVSVLNDGVELLRASSLLVSVIDDRVVMRDVELRLPSRDPDTGAMRFVILRGAQLVKQGTRIPAATFPSPPRSPPSRTTSSSPAKSRSSSAATSSRCVAATTTCACTAARSARCPTSASAWRWARRCPGRAISSARR